MSESGNIIRGAIKMIRDCLFRLSIGRLPCKDIGDGQGNTFFNRFTVIKTRWFSIYLHQFFRSDGDRCLHDHPWPFASLILRGGYWEEMRSDQIHPDEHYRDIGTDGFENWLLGPTARHWRRPGTLLIRKAATAHRIVLDDGSRPWSLVIVGRKVRDWRFFAPSGWWKWRPGATPICEEDTSTEREVGRA